MNPRPLLALVAIALVATPVRAEEPWITFGADALDPDRLPDNPSPPSIADLTHRNLWVGFETDVGSVKPNPDPSLGPQPRTFGVLSRLEAELAITKRRWYGGIAYEAAWGKAPASGGAHAVFGYPEIWARGVWASRAGLAYGGGLSIVPPIFHRDPTGEAETVAQGVRVVRPWDFALFAENTFTAMPFLDARVVDGRVTMQLRQGIGVQGSVAQVVNIPTASLISRTTLFLGYQPVQELGLGLELWEVYFLSADIPDYERAVFAVSPSIRLLTRMFQPSISAIFPFDRPLFGQVQSYWAVRLTLGAIFDEAQPVSE